MGSHLIKFPTKDWWGGTINLTGYAFHLWLGLPVQNAVIPVVPTLVTPSSGYSVISGQVSFSIRENDLDTWKLNPGTYPGELLASNDGGATTDVIWTGNLVINTGWLTDTF